MIEIVPKGKMPFHSPQSLLLFAIFYSQILFSGAFWSNPKYFDRRKHNNAFSSDLHLHQHHTFSFSPLGIFGKGGENAVNEDAPNLRSDFVWRLALVLQNPASPEFERPVQVYVRFVEDLGYEPPQGKVFIQDDPYELCATDEKGFAGFWQLSEDKDDRKDGLWVWGLFEEPLYPFLYFTLKTNEALTETLKTTEENSDKEETTKGKISIFGNDNQDLVGVPNNTLYARFNHRRLPKEVGTTLTEGILTFKATEIVKADILGISSADVGQNIECGSISALVLQNKKK